MKKIETEKEYSVAMERIEELLKIVTEETPQDDRNSIELVLLSKLVAEYDELKHPIKIE